MIGNEPQIPKFGGFRKLKSFRAARLVYDMTVEFCEAHTGSRSRAHDQMLRAAGAALQRIVEGSLAGEDSKKKELKLTGMARASLEELRLACETYLQASELPLWAADDPRRSELIERRPRSLDEVAEWMLWAHAHKGTLSTPSTVSAPSTPGGAATDPEIMANGVHTLITIAVSLLDRQLKGQTITLRREESASRRDSVEQLPTEWDG
ncbi:MAG: four helix bundle protein [Dehalococcoidia bacterium]|jgi:four helix bundle protein|nr:four helix bundle protein [Dehalococcoidia bacterium]